MDRSEGKCELCGSSDGLRAFTVIPRTDEIGICAHCATDIEGSEIKDPNHWRCLTESMWSQVTAVQVMAYRILRRLSSQGWAQDLLGMMYLDEDMQDWADAGGSAVVHLDSNGHVLQQGDSVVLIKDLNVKGANFTAKRGTAVRRINLVADNPEHIEGRVNDQYIVILTKYVKKS